MTELVNHQIFHLFSKLLICIKLTKKLNCVFFFVISHSEQITQSAQNNSMISGCNENWI